MAKFQSSLVKVVRCPYCRGEQSTGLICIDTDTIMEANQAFTNEPEAESVRTATRPILVYDPDGTANEPCPHLVSHIVDAELVRLSGEFACAVALEDSYDHNWFEQFDPDKSYNVFLWTELYGRKDSRKPTSPHVIKRFRRERPSPIKPWLFRISGTFFFAMNTVEFCEQLEEGYWRDLPA